MSKEEEEKDYQEILPGVWLGNHLSSEDKKFFRKNKIKAVLNTTKTLPNKFLSEKIEYMKIPVNDQLKQIDFDLMTEYLPFAVSFIRKHVIQKNNILIHCLAGKSRSAICMAGYLVKYHNMKPEQSIQFILKKRPEAFFHGTSVNFDAALDKLYKNDSTCKNKGKRSQKRSNKRSNKRSIKRTKTKSVNNKAELDAYKK
jgi:protein-tyrosine phosphatase